MTGDEDALDNYLIWELCKQEGVQGAIMDGSNSQEEQIEKIIENAQQKYREKDYRNSEKLDLLQKLDNNPDYRSKIFDNHSWKKETINIEELGSTLPRFGDLPPEVISGSLPEVVKFVRQADPEEYQSVKYIMRLKESPKVLNKFLPLILIPGNRTSKQDRMNKVHGEKDWNIQNTQGIINDGNHRVIAKILAEDLETLKCYIGRRRN